MAIIIITSKSLLAGKRFINSNQVLLEQNQVLVQEHNRQWYLSDYRQYHNLIQKKAYYVAMFIPTVGRMVSNVSVLLRRLIKLPSSHHAANSATGAGVMETTFVAQKKKLFV